MVLHCLKEVILMNLVGQKFGHYELIQLLGHGGFADVYLAQHIFLSTQMAIKVIDQQFTHNDLDNFKKEASILAQLLHPNILRLHDFGIEQGIPYLVMDYAPNGTLEFPKGTILQATDIRGFVKQAAAALQYVHDAKLVHCDVKPENFLLGPNHELWLSDFGIAVTSQNQQKQPVVGTVAYIAPEQLKGLPCAASDQYALAVVIYEWLCGSLPFDGDTGELIKHHLQDTPPNLRRKNSAVSPIIEQVVLKALAKDPQQRYAQVKDFADAFDQACQNALLQTARGHSLVTKALPTVPSNPTIKISPMFPTIVLGSTPIVSTIPIGNIPPVGTSLYTYRGHSNLVHAVAWSPDGSKLASGGDDRVVHVWEAATGNHLLSYREHTRAIRAMMWSPDGTLIASGSANQIGHVWQAATGKCQITYKQHRASSLFLAFSLAWSPIAGQRIASGGADKTVQVWEASTGNHLFTYFGHTGGILGATWSPDETYIASAGEDRTIQVWDASTGDRIVNFTGHHAYVRAAVWSPDGFIIASASEDATVQIWEATTGNTLLTYRNHNKRIRTIAWSPDGNYIASAGDEKIVQVWEAKTGKLVFTCEGHSAGINCVAWSPDGNLLATASNDMTVQMWWAK
jgi:WD40 repeat protein/tRNA A-37 threonylcarbamoyl transferase component Bud32